MPSVTLSKKSLLKSVGRKLSDEKLKDRISFLGTDLESIRGDNIELEIFPDRPDILSQEGFARAFKSFIGVKTGLIKYSVPKSGFVTKVGKQLKIWPYVVTAIVKGLKFDHQRIKDIIQLQEKLSVTLLRNRKKGGIGLYPLNKIKMPIRFTTMPADKISFRPLEFPKKITGRQILRMHPTGQRYGYIIEDQKEFPVFIDANDVIMSMPPIINSHDVGKIDNKTKDVFVEATGPDLNTLLVGLNIIISTLIDMGGKAYSMDVIYGKKRITTPNMRPSKMRIDVDYCNKILGLNLKAKDIKKYLMRMGFGIDKVGKSLSVFVPAYRNDIIHQIDLVEDVGIAYGFDNFEETIPNVATVAETSKLQDLANNVREVLAGHGLIEVKNYNLTSKKEQLEDMYFKGSLVEIENALSEEYAYLRAWIVPSLLSTLKTNKVHDYPQNIFEVGEVFKLKNSSDGFQKLPVEEALRVSVALCGEQADFTRIKQVFDNLMNALGLEYSIDETVHHSFIRGRVGRVNVKGKGVAYIGEMCPAVLHKFDLEMPVAVFELNLSDLLKVK
jgi:phenylalanyl-tRNA synthetase beta chain